MQEHLATGEAGVRFVVAAGGGAKAGLQVSLKVSS